MQSAPRVMRGCCAEGHGVPKVEPRLRRCFEQKSEARQLLEELRSDSQRAEGACDPSSQLLAAHAKVCLCNPKCASSPADTI